MEIRIQTVLAADIVDVWDSRNNPDDIKLWNAASDDWRTTTSVVDLREGGSFCSRMEPKDGSMGFDFSGTYTKIVPYRLFEYRLDDGRRVSVSFVSNDGKV